MDPISSGWFAARVCNGSAPLTGPAVLATTQHGDRLGGALVSAVCAESQAARLVALSEGPGAPTPRRNLRGEQRVATLAVVVPVMDSAGQDTDLVEPLGHELTADGIRVVERRQMTRAE